MKFKPTKIEAVVSLFDQNSYNSVEENGNVKWKDGHTTTAEEVSQINTEYDRLVAEYDAQEYARNRAPEYPAVRDQLDMLWHAIDTGDWTAAKVKTTDFYTKLKKVKDDNSKPS